MFLAEGVELSHEQKTEAGETIEIRLMPVAQAFELARRGGMKTAPCALAVLMCEPLLHEAGRGRATPDAQLET